MKAQGFTIIQNKYAEGYPYGKKYYGGCEFVWGGFDS